jgi:hypothetical protein
MVWEDLLSELAINFRLRFEGKYHVACRHKVIFCERNETFRYPRDLADVELRSKLRNMLAMPKARTDEPTYDPFSAANGKNFLPSALKPTRARPAFIVRLLD